MDAGRPIFRLLPLGRDFLIGYVALFALLFLFRDDSDKILGPAAAGFEVLFWALLGALIVGGVLAWMMGTVGRTWARVALALPMLVLTLFAADGFSHRLEKAYRAHILFDEETSKDVRLLIPVQDIYREDEPCSEISCFSVWNDHGVGRLNISEAAYADFRQAQPQEGDPKPLVSPDGKARFCLAVSTRRSGHFTRIPDSARNRIVNGRIEPCDQPVNAFRASDP